MKLILIAFLFILSMACINCSNKQTFIINGSITNSAYEGKTIYLSTLQSIHIDSASIVNGKFTFKGKVTAPQINSIKIDPVWPLFMEELLLVIEPGKIRATIDTKSFATGTQLNEIFQKWKKLKFENDDKRQILLSESYELKTNDNQNTLKLDLIQKKLQECDNEFISKTTGIILDNNQNILGLYLFRIYYSKISVNNKEKILATASESFLTDETVKRIKKDLSLNLK